MLANPKASDEMSVERRCQSAIKPPPTEAMAAAPLAASTTSRSSGIAGHRVVDASEEPIRDMRVSLPADGVTSQVVSAR